MLSLPFTTVKRGHAQGPQRLLPHSPAGEPVAGNHRFDERDLQLFADRITNGLGGFDFSRFDLNGDGATGGSERDRFDLDMDGGYGTVTQTIEGGKVDFDENALTDLQILCYYAYSPLYVGSEAERRARLGSALCAGGELFSGQLTTRASASSISAINEEAGSVSLVARIASDGSATVVSASGTHSYRFVTDLTVVPGGCVFQEVEATITGGTLSIFSNGHARFTPFGHVIVRQDLVGCGSPVITFEGDGEVPINHAPYFGTSVYQGGELTAIDFNFSLRSNAAVELTTGRLERQP